MSLHRRSEAAPTIEPGQVWLIEQASTAELGASEREAITSANVVLYERELEELVAEMLPLGSYAEPLSRDHRRDGLAIAARALQFAADGWSVVQLIAARPGRDAGLSLAPRAPENVEDLWVVGPLAARRPTQAALFTANGLAG
ncbi:MAG TPA: hypothetical protein VKQ73_07690 [Stellaceae bacterium]|nr:hypothetical protein [Stellaceae bacterium]